MAAKLALESKFLFVKYIGPDNFVGMSEYAKVHAIVKTFEDAYKSNLSLIVLDDIERLIEFIHIGPRFSNLILQTLLILIKKVPKNPNRKLMIIGTTSLKHIMEEMSVASCFNTCLEIPQLKTADEFKSVLENFSSDTAIVD